MKGAGKTRAQLYVRKKNIFFLLGATSPLPPWLLPYVHIYAWFTTCIICNQCATFIPSIQISHLPRLRQEFQRGASGLPGLNARSCVPVEPRIELDNVKEKCVKVNRRKVEIATVTLVVSRTFYKSNNQSMMDLKLLGT